MGSFGRQAADVGTEEEGVWLPEYLAIEMTSGTFYVWEAHSGPASTSDTYLQDLRWQRYPPAANESDTPGDQAVVYRLDAVLSGVSVPHAKEEVDEAPDIEDAVGGKRGFVIGQGLQEHFVCHSRVPKSYVERALSRGWGAAQAADASGKGVPDPSFLDPRAPSTGAGSLDAEDEFGRAVGANPNEWQWVRCNDFSCGRASSTEARNFAPWWRNPVLVMFRCLTGLEGDTKSVVEMIADDLAHPQPYPLRPGAGANDLEHPAAFADVDEPVIRFDAFHMNVQNGPQEGMDVPSVESSFPGRGQTVAIDAEFVATETEKTALTSDGRRMIVTDTRRSPARVSVIKGEDGSPLIDDHILQCEPVEDFLTRFSGITPADLDARLSTRSLAKPGLISLKLRWLIQRGVKVVGHGLQSDFRTLDLPVPPAQIVDTVELWSLPGQRKISLRFLASLLLNVAIQDDTHDSLEDARTANDLYRRWLEAEEKDEVNSVLASVYERGQALKWTLGKLTEQTTRRRL